VSVIKTWIGFDTETELIRPGVRAPRLACGQWTTNVEALGAMTRPVNEWPAHLENHWDFRKTFRGWLEDPSIALVGANAPYDVCVMMQDDPSIIPLAFRAYEQGRIHDVQTRQKLLDIAAGRYRKEFKGNRLITYKYSLGDLSRRLLGYDMNKPADIEVWDEKTRKMVTIKDPDHVRLRYSEVMDIPVEEWVARHPLGQAFIDYALDDGRVTIGTWLAQEVHHDWLEDQERQYRRDLWTSLMTAWGMRTHGPGVDQAQLEVENAMAELRDELLDLGLVWKVTKKKPEGSRNTKAAARLMLKVCKEKGLDVVATKTMEGKLRDGFVWVPTENELDGIALDADSCERTEDPTLIKYAKFGVLMAVRSKDIPMLRAGVTYPIHPRVDIVETGRTSMSSPNLQNIRRLPGIRECFIPRPGWVFINGDYPGGELRTLAQACLWLLGYSDLADTLRSGRDPHLMLAANIMGLSYEECLARYKAGDPEVKNTRQAAKVANFGYPGGLGAESFVDYARGSYGVILTEDEAKALKWNWQGTFREMKAYHKYVGDLCTSDHGADQITQLRSNRRRGRVRFCALANTYFQGLLADATSEAGWLIAKAMYLEELASPLFGSRLVDFIHDEYMGECELGNVIQVECVACKGEGSIKGKPCNSCQGTGVGWFSQRASDAVLEMRRLMVEGANPWIPDVPYKVEDIEPGLMTHWSKDAKSLVTPYGVQVWRGAQ
jgi:DNA polymerase I